MKFKLILPLILLSVIANTNGQQTITINITEDANLVYCEAYDRLDLEYTNYGASPTIRTFETTRYGDPYEGKSIMGVDLSSLPKNVIIIEAKLYLYGTGGNFPATYYTENSSYIRRVTTPWEENTVTWHDCPSVTDEDEVFLESATADAQDYVVDVTDIVKDIYMFPLQSYGLMLQLAVEEPYRDLRFASSENTDASLRPKLEVTYTEKSFEVYEGFEYPATLWGNVGGDNLNWIITSGSTSSSGTGPSSAYEGTYYAYIEASYPNYGNKLAILESPTYFVRPDDYASLSFNYHMYGSTMGQLNLDISTDNGTNWTNIWTRSGNQGDQWLDEEIDLTPYEGQGVQFRFAGTTGTSYTSDMAIDNVKIKVDRFDRVNLSDDQNYISAVSMMTEEGESGRYLQSVKYFDGLGRLKQDVSAGITPLGNDIVKPTVYDREGRIAKDYLPFPADDGIYGGFRDYEWVIRGDLSIQEEFYVNHLGLGADRPYSYARTVYEDSPLDRVVKQGSPGVTWQPEEVLGSGITEHVKEFEYGSNLTSDNIRLYTVNITTGALENNTPSYYPENELYKNGYYDEDGNLTEEFEDKLGRVVLKRTFDNRGTGVVTYSTYYVYDIFGLLRYVLPPKASADSEIPDATELAELCYQYNYDDRHRMTEKKLPGVDWVYMVYDGRDRLVGTQDGMLRNSNSWLYTKYDVLDRPVLTGIIRCSVPFGRTTAQTYVDSFYDNPLRAWYEEEASTTSGYTNQSYPISIPYQVSNYVQTVTYYDDYSFITENDINSVFINMSFNDSEDFIGYDDINGSNGYNDFVRGQITGTKVLVLDGTNSNWIRTVNYYDDEYRMIQSHQKMYPNGSTSIISTKYDFVGNILAAKEVQTVNSVQNTVVQDFEYDHAGRLIKTYITVNTEDPVLLSSLTYNELGELAEKELHAEYSDYASFLESTGYTYNIRGWLNNINSVDNIGNELFAMDLIYEDTQDNPFNNIAYYNGNISAINWSSNSEQKAYTYKYDQLNRLIKSHFYAYENDVWNMTDDYATTYIYDLNGNITELVRNQEGTTIDELTYEYLNGGNKLNKVDDEALSDNVIEGSDQNMYAPFLDYEEGEFVEYMYTASELSGMGLAAGDIINGLAFYVTEECHPMGYGFDIYIGFSSSTSLPVSSSGTCYVEEEEFLPNAGWTTFSFSNIVWNGTSNLWIRIEETENLGTGLSDGVLLTLTGFPGSYSSIEDDTENRRPWTRFTLSTAEYAYSGNLSNENGFYDRNSGTDFSYDDNGNMIQDLNKQINITYNYLNLPEIITSTNGSSDEISFIYDANGIKWEKRYSGSSLKNTLYAGAFIYDDQIGNQAYSLEYLLHPEGMYLATTNDFEYFLKDHLGNTRITFNATNGQVVQAPDYYPFGLTFAETQGGDNKYLYNGKELQDDIIGGNNLDWYDYGARFYDPQLARFSATDPWTEKYSFQSPYLYAYNNPVRYTDYRGMGAEDEVDDEQKKKEEEQKKKEEEKKRLEEEKKRLEEEKSKAEAAERRAESIKEITKRLTAKGAIENISMTVIESAVEYLSDEEMQKIMSDPEELERVVRNYVNDCLDFYEEYGYIPNDLLKEEELVPQELVDASTAVDVTVLVANLHPVVSKVTTTINLAAQANYQNSRRNLRQINRKLDKVNSQLDSMQTREVQTSYGYIFTGGGGGHFGGGGAGGSW